MRVVGKIEMDDSLVGKVPIASILSLLGVVFTADDVECVELKVFLVMIRWENRGGAGQL